MKDNDKNGATSPVVVLDQEKASAPHPMNDDSCSSYRPTTYCYLLTAMACLNSCNMGYDVGSTGGAAILMKEEMG